jgi:hypothetical protein
MLGLISFGLKIIFASIVGGALNYIPGESENSKNIVETSLICVFSASLMGLARQFADKGEYIAMGFGVLAVLIVIMSISKNLEFGKRIIWLFSGVVGMIIGAGFFIQACLLSALIFLILRNSENLLDYIHKQPEEMGDTSI